MSAATTAPAPPSYSYPASSTSVAASVEDDGDLSVRLKSLQRRIEFVEVQAEYVKDEQQNLIKRRAQEEVKRIKSVPLVIGQFMEMVDGNNGIVGSTTGSNDVRILSTIVNRDELLKPSPSVALHHCHSNALVDVLPPEADSGISLPGSSEKPNVTYNKDDTNHQLMGKANEDGERGEEEDATALPKDYCRDDGAGAEDGGSGPEHGNTGLENHDSGKDGSGMASKDSNDESCQREPRPHEELGKRAVQLLGIRANFPICEIYGFDLETYRRIYMQPEGEVQEEGMVDLVLTGPREVLMAYGLFGLQVYDDDGPDPLISEDWAVEEDEEIEEYTHIFEGHGRELEITYLVIPYAIEASVEFKLKLKDLGSRSRAVYGKIKASAPDYRNKSVHLFSCERGTGLSFPSGSTCILPLSPSKVAVPCRWELELHIEVDLSIITTCDSQEEQAKNLKFNLEFTDEIMTQEREVDDDQVEVNIEWCRIW